MYMAFRFGEINMKQLKLYQVDMKSDELQVVGDYYHAFDYENIAVSYRILTDSAHLLYYRDDDSDGSYVRQALPD